MYRPLFCYVISCNHLTYMIVCSHIETMIAPVESIIYLGDHATFSCYTSCSNAHQWWEVFTNSSYNKREDHDGSRHDIYISGLKTNATLQCSVFCDVKWSGNASLQIQGIVLHMSLSWHLQDIFQSTSYTQI